MFNWIGQTFSIGDWVYKPESQAGTGQVGQIYGFTSDRPKVEWKYMPTRLYFLPVGGRAVDRTSTHAIMPKSTKGRPGINSISKIDPAVLKDLERQAEAYTAIREMKVQSTWNAMQARDFIDNYAL